MRRPREIKVCVPAGDDQRQRRLVAWIFANSVILSERSESKDLLLGFTFIQQHGMDVPFQMVDGNQRQFLRKSQRLGIGNAHQQRPGKSRSGSYRDGVEVC